MDINLRRYPWPDLKAFAKAMTEEANFNLAKEKYLDYKKNHLDSSNTASFAFDLPMEYVLKGKASSPKATIYTYKRICLRCGETELRTPEYFYRKWFIDPIPDNSQCQNCLCSFNSANVFNTINIDLGPTIHTYQPDRSFIYIKGVDLLDGTIEGTVLNPICSISLNADTRDEVLDKINDYDTSSLLPLREIDDFSHQYGIVGFAIRAHEDKTYSWSVYDRFSNKFTANILSSQQHPIKNLGRSTVLLNADSVAECLDDFISRFCDECVRDFPVKSLADHWKNLPEKDYRQSPLDILFNYLKENTH